MRATLCLSLLLAVAGTACSPTVDLKASLQVVDVSTGWADLGVVNGQNKIVPSITFTLKNVGTQPITTLQANVIFRRVGEDEEWGAGFLRITGSEGLAPGASSKSQTVNSTLGYTGSETRAQMMANKQFVDGRAQVFAKYASTQWTLLAEFPVERRLITK
ncbi:MAG TPA: hypothetical protein VM032_06590 [Vicinamibacterales bacterium]|nr:hypothetical protein [Vicinamibacterales bacterium]